LIKINIEYAIANSAPIPINMNINKITASRVPIPEMERGNDEMMAAKETTKTKYKKFTGIPNAKTNRYA